MNDYEDYLYHLSMEDDNTYECSGYDQSMYMTDHRDLSNPLEGFNIKEILRKIKIEKLKKIIDGK